MYVSRIELSNIRCYVGASIDFSPTITLIAGENNSGKSTVIHSLYMLQAGVIGHDSVRDGAPRGSIGLSLNEVRAELFPVGNRETVQNAGRRDVSVRFELQVEPAGVSAELDLGPAGRATFHQFPQSQPGNLIVPYLSERRGPGLSEGVGGQLAFSVAGNLHNLVAKIDRCLSSFQLNPEYQDACARVLGFVVTTYPSPNGKMAGLELDARQQRYIPVTRMGAGVAQVLGLIVELLVARNKIFLIEEIENDLHPTALRKLLELVEAGARAGNQFVISTHSNVVVRALGSVEGTRVWRTERFGSQLPPESKLSEVENEPGARRALLQTLGYDLVDYDLYDAWLILEESSAERLIREFVIPLFASGLTGRIRTLAAQGASDVEPRFIDLHRLFVFIHLEPIYRSRAWVLTDGDEAGHDAVRRLRRTFATWPEDHFVSLSEHDFEKYYPPAFDDRVRDVLAIADRDARKLQKAQLVEDVVAWLREDRDRGRLALVERAGEVIERIRSIEAAVAGSPAA